MIAPHIVANIPVSFYRRKPGGALHYRFTANGERYRESTGVSNERDARAVVRPIVIKALEARPSKSPFALMTLRELLTVYLDERWPEDPESIRKGNRSYMSAKSRLNSFASVVGDSAHFAGMTFDEARVLIQSYVDNRKASLSAREDAGNFANTLNSDRISISKLCSWLMKRQAHNAWQANPAGSQRIEIPTSVIADPEPLDDIEAEMVATAGREVELWPLIVLCLGVGTRPAEAIRAEWSDVNFGCHMIAVTNKKAKRARPRYPVLSKWAEAELTQWRQNHSSDVALWPFNKFTAYDKMAELREALGLPDHVTLQALRQTACTRAIASGMRLADYVMQFGHSLEVARNHYLKFGKQELADRRDQVDAGMFKISST